MCDKHEWNNISNYSDESVTRLHSHKCEMLVPFLSPHKIKICRECSQFVVHHRKYAELKKQKCKEPIAQTEKSVSVTTGVQTEDNTDLVNLHDLDHQDLIEMIQKLIPMAPEFDVILQSQLRNA